MVNEKCAELCGMRRVEGEVRKGCESWCENLSVAVVKNRHACEVGCRGSMRCHTEDTGRRVIQS